MLMHVNVLTCINMHVRCLFPFRAGACGHCSSASQTRHKLESEKDLCSVYTVLTCRTVTQFMIFMMMRYNACDDTMRNYASWIHVVGIRVFETEFWSQDASVPFRALMELIGIAKSNDANQARCSNDSPHFFKGPGEQFGNWLTDVDRHSWKGTLTC